MVGSLVQLFDQKPGVIELTRNSLLRFLRNRPPVEGCTHMMIAVTAILGLLAVNFAALYWKGLGEARSLSEFAQHLLLEPESCADHRGKFLAYLAGTTAKTSMKRSVDAGAVLARIAEITRSQLMLSNAAGRNDVAPGRVSSP
jgi:hypothetical protein